jgi:hypothetical protein
VKDAGFVARYKETKTVMKARVKPWWLGAGRRKQPAGTGPFFRGRYSLSVSSTSKSFSALPSCYAPLSQSKQWRQTRPFD